jgi:hypothetical protein
LQIFKSGGTRSIWFFIGKLDLTILNGKVIEDNYELIEVDSPLIKPCYPKVLKEKSGLSKKSIKLLVTIPLYRYFVVENPIDL